jgi:hypothetical protein
VPERQTNVRSSCWLRHAVSASRRLSLRLTVDLAIGPGPGLPYYQEWRALGGPPDADKVGSRAEIPLLAGHFRSISGVVQTPWRARAVMQARRTTFGRSCMSSKRCGAHVPLTGQEDDVGIRRDLHIYDTITVQPARRRMAERHVSGPLPQPGARLHAGRETAPPRSRPARPSTSLHSRRLLMPWPPPLTDAHPLSYVKAPGAMLFRRRGESAFRRRAQRVSAGSARPAQSMNSPPMRPRGPGRRRADHRHRGAGPESGLAV